MDDYTPPVYECPNCGHDGSDFDADFSDDVDTLTCPECGHTFDRPEE